MKKNNFFNTKMVISVFAILILIIVSCKKNEFSKDELFVYTSPGNITNNSYIANYVTARTILYPSNVPGVPALITRPYNSDVQITAKIDTSLLRVYDSINGTTSLAIPPGAFALRNNGIVNIKAGQTSSIDSFYLDIIDTSKLDQSKSYIAPIILTANNAGISISPARQIMYLKISFKGAALSSIKFFNGNSTLFTDIKHTPTIGISGPDKIIFGGFLNNTIFPNDARITIIEDPLLIQEYNQKNNTKYKPFPAGTYKLLKDNVTVPSMLLQSADSFSVSISNLPTFEMDSTYLLAFKMKDEGSVSPDSKNNIVYTVLTVINNNINNDNKSVPGIAIDRTGWKVTVSTQYSNYGAANILDGIDKTSWDSNNEGKTGYATATLDMGKSFTIKGMQIVPNYVYVEDNSSQIDVATSQDGINWKNMGRYYYTGPIVTATNFNAPDVLRNINFYGPVITRYIRLRLITTSYTGMSEWNVYQ